MKSYSSDEEVKEDVYLSCIEKYSTILEETISYYENRPYRIRGWQSIEVERLRGLVIDIGSGYAGKSLLKLGGKDTRFVLLDLSWRILEKTCPNNPRVICIAGDAMKLPFIDKIFDTALMLAVVHHIPGRECRLLAFQEAQRVLRHGGYLYVTVWNPLVLPKSIEFENGLILKDETGQRYIHILDLEEIKKYAESAGLEVVTLEYITENPRKPKVTRNVFLKARKPG
ncbi:class I SAM-dependent methyltransferase [Thermogladius sp. 4427co]|uniref:class I SAM-dependent methyltransferase n=1 Tax=Thermogladius sp. 4427co TaxID=3450718 RepID=UPI003F790503